MARILITGASGHIGRHVVPHLAIAHDVLAVVRGTTPAEWTPKISVLTGDVLNHPEMDEALKRWRPEVLVHLAWEGYLPNYLEAPVHAAWEAASMKLFESFCQLGGRHAVFAGSWYERTLPATAYSIAKTGLRQKAFALAERRGITVAWCRIHGTYGPFDRPQKFIPSAIAKLLRGETMHVQQPDARWDYLHVNDVATAFSQVAESNYHGDLEIASGVTVSLGELYRLLETVCQGALPEKIPTTPCVGKDHTLRELDWRPSLDLEAGLVQTADWHRRNC